MEHELGSEISVDGMPSWLGGDEKVKPRWDKDNWYPDISLACCVASPESVTAIRLRADHPYYLATSKGFTYWPGGESAPDDWDGGEVLLRHRGRYAGCAAWIGDGIRWHHVGIGDDIIGYRKRMEPQQQDATPTRPSDELVERMVDVLQSLTVSGYVNPHVLAEVRAILAALNPDPMIQRARDICKDEFGVVLPDDAPGMRAVLRGLREGGCQ